jgi:alkylation response protein AidB-like acyl-CoA dehydrogenase
MDFELTEGQRELRERAATLVDEVLIPLEVDAELAGGRIEPPSSSVRARASEAAARRRQTTPPSTASQVAGRIQQVLVHEELGRNTNGIWWVIGGGYNVLSRGTPEQIERYLLPTLRGERADSYAVTEAGAGSDPSGIATTAQRVGGGWRSRGEKWLVTSGAVWDCDLLVV